MGHRFDSIGHFAVLVIAFSLPFHGIGGWTPELWGMSVNTWLLIALCPLLVLSVVQRLSWLLRSPLALSISALAAIELLSTLVVHGSSSPLRDVARTGMMVLIVYSVALSASEPSQLRRLLRAIALGGALAVVISLVGFFVQAPWSDGIQPFYYLSAHPLFGAIPRLSGTFGHSPQHFGEFLVFLLVVLSLPQLTLSRRILIPFFGATLFALLLTMSSAWVGGLVALGALLLTKQRRSKRTIWAFLVLLVMVELGALWLMNVGLPSTFEGAGAVEVSCEDADSNHYVTSFDGMASGTPTTCFQFVIHGFPYERRLTLYAEAKAAALEVFSENPWFGVGAEEYPRFARSRALREYGGEALSFYPQPHCTYLRSLALYGVPGGVALLLFVASVFAPLIGKSGDNTSLVLCCWGIFAFLLIGCNIDIMWQRHLWVLVGVTLGLWPPHPARCYHHSC